MTLLSMINSVRGKLREERIASISATDYLTTEIIDLINDSKDEILHEHDWKFNVRHDGLMYFPQVQEGTNSTYGGSTRWGNPKLAHIYWAGDDGVGEIFNTDASTKLSGWRMGGDRWRTRIVPTGTSDASASSWIVTDFQYVALTGFTLTLQNDLYIDDDAYTGTYAWKTFSNEYVLPTTVRRILSARHEEHPLRLVEIGKDIDYDQFIPRAWDTATSTPEILYQGFVATSTTISDFTTPADTTAVTGQAAGIWPVPSVDIRVHYSYQIQYADMSSATDTLAGIPQDIVHLIEWNAVKMAYDSGIKNDVQRASRAERQVEKRLARAISADAASNQRRIPTAYGISDIGPYRRRWASQTITAP